MINLIKIINADVVISQYLYVYLRCCMVVRTTHLDFMKLACRSSRFNPRAGLFETKKPARLLWIVTAILPSWTRSGSNSNLPNVSNAKQYHEQSNYSWC